MKKTTRPYITKKQKRNKLISAFIAYLMISVSVIGFICMLCEVIGV